MDTESYKTKKEGSSLGSLASSVMHEATALIRDEVELAKVETREKVSQVTTSLVSMMIAGGVLLSGFIVLLASAVFGLDTVLHKPWLSALIVGAVVIVIGFIMLQGSKKKLKTANLAPERTMASLKEDQDMAKKHEGKVKEQLK